MNWPRKLRRFFAAEAADHRPFSRRRFIGGLGGIALGAGLLYPNEAWADVEERAHRFGIKPGTLVDAQGRPLKRAGLEPFIGEIIMFGGDFAPRGWALCDGQLLPINQNQSLYSLLGTTYGGDGKATFALPDLRGRFPLHPGLGPGLTPRGLGETGGAETATLAVNQIPPHRHTMPAPQKVLVRGTGDQVEGITVGGDQGAAGEGATGDTGGGQPHNNMSPFLAVNFIIATEGIYPSRN